MPFHLGCAIWAYKGWIGELFPPGSQSSELLQLYSQRFTTVEGNTTFYSIPAPETVRRWATETPSGFQFCLKLPKTLTHTGHLTSRLADTRSFLDRMAELGDRLGPFFAQLPPSYSPTDLNDLEAFLTALPHDQMEFALEVRHPAWFKEPYQTQLTDLLTHLGMGRVLLDTRPIYDVPDDPQLAMERRKPRLPLQRSVTTSFSLIRYVSHPTLEMNQPFMQAWVQDIKEWLRQGKRIYFFVHCPVEERSPANARHFQALLERAETPIPPLPWNTLRDSTPTQLNLFSC